jgi:phosphatidylglycerophosphatase C
MSRPVAFFDFDGTLTRGDSLIPFLRMVRGTSRFALDLLAASPWLSAYAVGLIRNDIAKEVLLRKSIGGASLDALQAHGRYFAEHFVSKMLRTDMMARLRDHQKQGDCCVLVSASLDIYLEPWAKTAGFDYCITSSLVVDANGAITGRLLDGNCFGEEKVRRIQHLLDKIGTPSRSYAYGDSEGDIPMLSMVDEGYRVQKSIQTYPNIKHQ